MKMYLTVLISILFLGTLGVPIKNKESFIVNDLLDETLNKINNDASIDTKLKINSIIFGDYHFKGGELSNIKTLKRSGDASMWSNGKKVTVSGDLNLEEMLFTAAMLKSKTNITVVITNNKFAFLFQAELDTKSACEITEQSIIWEKLEGKLFSDNLDFNNITFALNSSQLSQLNSVPNNNEDILTFLKNHMPICQTVQSQTLSESNSSKGIQASYNFEFILNSIGAINPTNRLIYNFKPYKINK